MKRILLLLLIAAGFNSVVHSATLTVTNTNNTGAGSLRVLAQGAVNGDIIQFSPSLISAGSVTITVATPITITAAITINGLINGTDTLFLSGGDLTNIFIINPATATATTKTILNNLVFIHGRQVGGYGGAINCNKGHLDLNNCVLRDNYAEYGGGIYMLASDFTRNFTLTVNNCSFYKNESTSRGGAINIERGNYSYNQTTLYLNYSSFYNNKSLFGSAVWATSGSSNNESYTAMRVYVYVNQSTFANNSCTGSNTAAIDAASSNGGGTGNSANTYVIAANSTFLNNTPYGISAVGYTSASITLESCIMANSPTWRNAVINSITSAGHRNIFTVSSVAGSNANDQLGVPLASLNLTPLAYNGGPTKTLMPVSPSVAIDMGGGDLVPAQNGPIIGIRDAGAAEQLMSFSTDIISSCGPYTWINGVTYVANNNTAKDTLTDVNGYDSIVTLNLTIHQPTTSTLNQTACSSYTLNGTTYTTSGAYTQTLTNAAGCDSIITINLTISDLIAPVADLASLPNVTGQCSVNSLTAPTATDNCAGTITGTHNITLPITTSGTTVVTWTYNDGHGNSSTQTQNVIITDNTVPVANTASLANVTAQCSVTSLTAPTATDNCAGTITGTHNMPLPITTSGTTVVTWTYNDGHGNSSTQTQNVIINDNTAPVANTAALSDVTAQCSVTSLTAPTATDNCAGTITGTHNATLPITTQGTTVVTWTYNDGHGNSSTQTQNVIINDNTAPVANTAALSDVTAQCSVTSLTAPTATDNCVGTITGTHNATLPITTQGTTVVTWTYNDGHGNSSTQTQNVIINDNTAPVANTAALSDVTAQCSVTSLTAPTATDNCVGTITGTHNATLPITTQGTIVVTWTYNDGHGNSSTQTQNVVISDNSAPVANLANLPALNGNCSVASLVAPSATDNCTGTITGTHNATLPITAPGTTVVTWTYNDGHGNTSTQTQNVIVTVPVATTTVSGLTITATTSGASYQWINCGTGNTPIAGATAQSFTATANGTYAVIVTQNGCSATSSCVTISTVGLEDLTMNLFAVYPNPNTGIFKVVNALPVTIHISNSAGQEVAVKLLEAGENTIELLGVESGIYFITATDPNGQVIVHRVSIIK